ncbi:putative Importin subunit beta-2 [Blattamonas nauphoetae]|uniref:Importin subunit beta-2 n=1 Tax=Blattamonas nauphoetae TaxID=2049346 RepID=A0ABQ9XXK0_9EUKA|nr:putative Importin subunit beta-2 [Blattamonas nauphoetae]
MPSMETIFRQLAGTQLRILFEQDRKWNADDKQATLYSILPGLGDEQRNIRTSVSSCIASFIVSIGFENALPFLGQLLEQCRSDNPVLAAGACTCLYQIVEDNAQRLDNPQLAESLSQFVTQLVPLLENSQSECCADILAALMLIFKGQPSLFSNSLSNYMQNIFKCITHPDLRIQATALEALTDVTSYKLDNHPVVAVAHELVQHVLQCMSSPDENLSFIALDFWSAVPENKQVCEIAVAPRLTEYVSFSFISPRIAKALMDKLFLGDGDLRQYEQELQNKPTTGQDEDDDEDDYLDGMAEGEDTFRKAAARAISSLAREFPNEMVHAMLPEISLRFNNSDPSKWDTRESGVFALGLLARNCQPFLHSQLGEIIPWVVNFCSDPHFLVRLISCWTLTRFSVWICGPLDQRDVRRGYVSKEELDLPRAADQTHLQNALGTLTQHLLDDSRHVRASVCQAIADLVEEARSRIVVYAHQLLDLVLPALEQYEDEMKKDLFNVIAQLVIATGGMFNEAQLLARVMNPLLALMNSRDITDDVVLPSLLESTRLLLDAVDTAALTPYLVPIMTSCIGIVSAQNQKVNEDIQRYRGDPAHGGQLDEMDIEAEVGQHEAIAASEALETIIKCIDTTTATMQQELFTQLNFHAFLQTILHSPSKELLWGSFNIVSLLVRCNLESFTTPLPDGSTLLSTSFPVLSRYCVPDHLKQVDEATGTITISFADSLCLSADLEFRLSNNALIAIADIVSALGHQMSDILPSLLPLATPLLYLAAPIVGDVPILYNPTEVDIRDTGIQLAKNTAGCLSRLAQFFPIPVCQALAQVGVVPHFLACLVEMGVANLVVVEEMKGLVQLVMGDADCFNTLLASPTLLIEALATFMHDPNTGRTTVELVYNLPDEVREGLKNSLDKLRQGMFIVYISSPEASFDASQHSTITATPVRLIGRGRIEFASPIVPQKNEKSHSNVVSSPTSLKVTVILLPQPLISLHPFLATAHFFPNFDLNLPFPLEKSYHFMSQYLLQIPNPFPPKHISSRQPSKPHSLCINGQLYRTDISFNIKRLHSSSSNTQNTQSFSQFHKQDEEDISRDFTLADFVSYTNLSVLQRPSEKKTPPAKNEKSAEVEIPRTPSPEPEPPTTHIVREAEYVNRVWRWGEHGLSFRQPLSEADEWMALRGNDLRGDSALPDIVELDRMDTPHTLSDFSTTLTHTLSSSLLTETHSINSSKVSLLGRISSLKTMFDPQRSEEWTMGKTVDQLFTQKHPTFNRCVVAECVFLLYGEPFFSENEQCEAVPHPIILVPPAINDQISSIMEQCHIPPQRQTFLLQATHTTLTSLAALLRTTKAQPQLSFQLRPPSHTFNPTLFSSKEEFLELVDLNHCDVRNTTKAFHPSKGKANATSIATQTPLAQAASRVIFNFSFMMARMGHRYWLRNEEGKHPKQQPSDTQSARADGEEDNEEPHPPSDLKDDPHPPSDLKDDPSLQLASDSDEAPASAPVATDAHLSAVLQSTERIVFNVFGSRLFGTSLNPLDDASLLRFIAAFEAVWAGQYPLFAQYRELIASSGMKVRWDVTVRQMEMSERKLPSQMLVEFSETVDLFVDIIRNLVQQEEGHQPEQSDDPARQMLDTSLAVSADDLLPFLLFSFLSAPTPPLFSIVAFASTFSPFTALPHFAGTKPALSFAHLHSILSFFSSPDAVLSDEPVDGRRLVDVWLEPLLGDEEVLVLNDEDESDAKEDQLEQSSPSPAEDTQTEPPHDAIDGVSQPFTLPPPSEEPGQAPRPSEDHPRPLDEPALIPVIIVARPSPATPPDISTPSTTDSDEHKAQLATQTTPIEVYSAYSSAPTRGPIRNPLGRLLQNP